jgi:hypothetical protein
VFEDGPAFIPLVGCPVVPVALDRIWLDTEPLYEVTDFRVADPRQLSIHQFTYSLPIHSAPGGRTDTLSSRGH